MVLHRSVRAPHIVHEHHGLRDQVQVHADGGLDEEVDADAAAVAGLGNLQVLTEMRWDEVRSVWDPKRDKSRLG